jgi:hypothetical protein
MEAMEANCDFTRAGKITKEEFSIHRAELNLLHQTPGERLFSPLRDFGQNKNFCAVALGHSFPTSSLICSTLG